MQLSRQGEIERSWYSKMSRESLFFFLVVFAVFIFCIEVALFEHVDINQETNLLKMASELMVSNIPAVDHRITLPAHLVPHVPILPLFNSIVNADEQIANLLDGRASMVGVVAILQKFILELHDSNIEAKKTDGDEQVLFDNFFNLADKYIRPFDNAYQGKYIFPVREDGSIFISLAAFREGYLLETLNSAFKNARNPEKVFVGAVVQNCFGKFLEDGTLDSSGSPCFTGARTIGKKENGKDIRKKLEVPIDKNGVEVFCAQPNYAQYCRNGQIRVLYMHHTDGQGPSMARYYASKLWGGENYFFQIDSHLRFAHEWDAKYITEMKLTLNYPKSVLSAYPPGFEQVRFIPKHMGVDLKKVNNDTVIESPGCRLCGCGTAPNRKDPMIIINQSKSYRGNETRPAQTPFLGAGLVFTHGGFLKDVPFDPYLPWTFMGEEILLSMRAWTNGWNIYAPRKNLVIHQYRPAKLGLPKVFGSMREANISNNWLQQRTNRRIKHLCGYPTHTVDMIEEDGLKIILADVENYGLGSTRSWNDFLEFSQINVNSTTGEVRCPKKLDWCINQLLE